MIKLNVIRLKQFINHLSIFISSITISESQQCEVMTLFLEILSLMKLLKAIKIYDLVKNKVLLS